MGPFNKNNQSKSKNKKTLRKSQHWGVVINQGTYMARMIMFLHLFVATLLNYQCYAFTPSIGGVKSRGTGLKHRLTLRMTKPEQEIQDLSLEEMFEVFEAADEVVSNEEAGMAPATGDRKIAEASDPFKQYRVFFYIAISLVPILFLLPFLSSGEFKPLDPALLESMQ